MKKAEKEELDEFFKSALIVPEITEVDEDWERMKSILLKNDTNTGMYYWIIVSSLAAVMILVFSVMFYSPDPIQRGENIKTNSPIKEEPVLQDTATGPSITIADPVLPFGESSTNTSLQTPEMLDKSRGSGNNFKNISPLDLEDNALRNLPTAKEVDTSSKDEIIAAKPLIDLTGDLSAKQTADPADISNVIPDSLVFNKQTIDPGNPKPSKNRFSLSFNVAPDVSGVENFKNTAMGYSIGTSLSYNFYKKFSMEAGIAYGSKVYKTNFSNYKPASSYVFRVKPNDVSANCEVLDVQFNLAYNLLNKGKNQFGFATGLSSYIMLQEKYVFQYANSSAWGPRRYNVKNQNQHYLGLVNLIFSYKRNLTNNTSLSFSPYYKLPLTDIGYGNIRLRSAGLSIGITTNLKKPE
ncbi:MAG: porin family protein [Daejeonella sp.]